MYLKLLVLILTSTITLSAHSHESIVDSVSVEYGSGNKTNLLRVALQNNWSTPVWRYSKSQIDGYWDFSLAQWRGRRYQQMDSHQWITAIGVTPVFRWQKSEQRGLYGELGIGAYLLSELYNNNGRRFSTRFQFGDHIGVGYRWDQAEFGLRFQHFSNAGIKKPNHGVNFFTIRYAHQF